MLHLLKIFPQVPSVCEANLLLYISSLKKYVDIRITYTVTSQEPIVITSICSFADFRFLVYTRYSRFHKSEIYSCNYLCKENYIVNLKDFLVENVMLIQINDRREHNTG